MLALLHNFLLHMAHMKQYTAGKMSAVLQAALKLLGIGRREKSSRPSPLHEASACGGVLSAAPWWHRMFRPLRRLTCAWRLQAYCDAQQCDAHWVVNWHLNHSSAFSRIPRSVGQASRCPARHAVSWQAAEQ